MRTLLRYLVISGAVLGLAWALVAVEIGGRSVYGHVRAGGATRLLTVAWSLTGGAADSAKAGWTDLWSGHLKREPTVRANSAKKTADPNQVSKRRVTLLKEAARKAQPHERPQIPPGKTRIDERLSQKQKNALDEIVAARVAKP